MRAASAAALVLAALTACSGGSSAPSGAAGTASGPAAAKVVCSDTPACEEACGKGDGAACAIAAEAYFDGKNGHPLDMVRTFALARRGCDLDHPLGCSLLGYQYQDGLGIPWDPPAAITAYEKACKLGAGSGCFNLASIYTGGHGVVSDLDKADELEARAAKAWRAACEGSEPRWCTNVAFMIAKTAAPLTDALRAEMLKLDERTCAADIPVGCVEAIRLKLELKQLTDAEAAPQLEALCTQGEPTACFFAGSMIGENTPQGLALWKRGCQIGDKQTCSILGGRSNDVAESMRYFEQACDRGSALGCYNGAQRAPDLERAADLSLRACHMGLADGCVDRARIAVRTTPPNATPADVVEWLRLGCMMGSIEACIVVFEKVKELPVPASALPEIKRQACTAGVRAACP